MDKQPNQNRRDSTAGRYQYTLPILKILQNSLVSSLLWVRGAGLRRFYSQTSASCRIHQKGGAFPPISAFQNRIQRASRRDCLK